MNLIPLDVVEQDADDINDDPAEPAFDSPSGSVKCFLYREQGDDK